MKTDMFMPNEQEVVEVVVRVRKCIIELFNAYLCSLGSPDYTGERYARQICQSYVMAHAAQVMDDSHRSTCYSTGVSEADKLRMLRAHAKPCRQITEQMIIDATQRLHALAKTCG